MSSLRVAVGTYVDLIKPKIIMGNLITMAGAFFFASKESIHWPLFAAALIGLFCVIGSGCVFNNYMDRTIDQKMQRTQQRALAIGSIPQMNALAFGAALGLLGALVFWYGTNAIATFLALLGFFTYVFVYSRLKTKTIHATIIGSIAGAMPPVIGIAAVTNRIDLPAILLFFILVFWQMPHFFAIAMYRFEDYTAAQIPVLPIVRGARIARRYMQSYIVLFTLAALSLGFLGYADRLYMSVAALLGVIWFAIAWRGNRDKGDAVWAKGVFRSSLIVITALFFMLGIQ